MTQYSTLRAGNIARQIEWDKDNDISLAYRGNELAGEVGEACNVIKKLERERLGIRGSRATIDQLAEELADAVICLDLIAMQAGIDLDAATRAKFNATSEKYGLETRLCLPLDGPTRCEICDWPLADSSENGCVPGDCCYRPSSPAEQERIKRRRAELSSQMQNGEAL